MFERDFHKILLEAIDEALSCLGETAKGAIYSHLDKSFKNNKSQIPMKIGVFAEAMEKTFGLGAKFLEILIVSKLHEKSGGDFQLQK